MQRHKKQNTLIVLSLCSDIPLNVNAKNNINHTQVRAELLAASVPEGTRHLGAATC